MKFPNLTRRDPDHADRRWRGRLTLAGVLVVGLLAGGIVFADDLQTAEQVRSLSVEQAQHHDPVRVRGVVTFFDERLFSRFIADNTAGIYLRESTNTPGLKPGQWVEVTGVTSPGEYAPVIDPRHVEILGTAPLPAARPVTFDQLASGKEDSQFVEISGIVRSVRRDGNTQFYLIDIATGGGRLVAYTQHVPVAPAEDLVDSTVRVRGVCSTQFNRLRQLFAIRLMVPRDEDLAVIKPAVADPFAVPTSSIASLLQFSPQGIYGHRVKIVGTVVYHQPGNALFVQDEQSGLYIQSTQTNALAVGDRVEVLGFPVQGVYTPVLRDSVYRVIGKGTPPVPESIDLGQALKGSYDCRLVCIRANLLDRAGYSGEEFLVLESSGFIFHAYLEEGSGADAFAKFENGSEVEVTGVCLVEPGDWMAGESWRAKSFHLLLRSPADVVVLHTPSWWTLKRLLWTVGILGVAALAAFGWVGVLRHRVQEQTGIIRQQLRDEAALKERYEDLFENANDMVFTFDRDARITSINTTGELLLQRHRTDLVGRNLVDLLADDQRAAARQWIEQVVRGPETPTAEWDFLNASGQRVKLEISTRLTEPEGKPAEVEGIARDVTERRRLEREILEISNREQRRIGHDLHDGVCQQLAGIAYLVDVLADRLQEKHQPESADAEKIGNLINQANAQARGVARGLFPVRLEENGLVSALEELADGASQRFNIQCRFNCTTSLSAVDSEVVLHLYFIAQEALLNAVKHGKASHVTLSLERRNNHFALGVQDDGVGFSLPGQSRTGMGVRIMRYRAGVIGATLDLKSEPGHGTQLVCEFDPKAQEAEREPRTG